MHDFVRLGFNQTEAGGRGRRRRPEPRAGGASGGFFNYRFAQPGGTMRQHIGRWYPERQFPFANQVTTDPVTGQTDGVSGGEEPLAFDEGPVDVQRLEAVREHVQSACGLIRQVRPHAEVADLTQLVAGEASQRALLPDLPSSDIVSTPSRRSIGPGHVHALDVDPSSRCRAGVTLHSAGWISLQW